MKVVAVIQARMSSTRLPGKVLMPLAGQPVLWHVVDRLRACKTIQAIVVATSTDVSDDVIEQWCQGNGVQCFRGSLTDVLDRYVQAARASQADAVLRITADCPAIDPDTVDEVVAGFLADDFDFYGLKGEFPDGLDCTVFATCALEKAWLEAKLPSEREHLGPYIEQQPHLFKNGGFEKYQGLQHHRWTLDEPRDYAFLQAVFDRLYRKESHFSAVEVLDLLAHEPALYELNSNIVRNEGYLKSLIQDKQCTV
jgi:spore coat polysaccharide biosynthesis protein SpsF